MPTVRVTLDDVVCANTEDVTGADHFYIIGAISLSDTSQGILTTPVRINDGQTVAFPTGGGLVFEGIADFSQTIHVALAAFDEDAAKDWSNHGALAAKIGETVGAGLSQLPHPAFKVAAVALPIAIAAAGSMFSLDRDDALGAFSEDIPISTLIAGRNPRSWAIRGGNWWWSDWLYAVRWTIVVTP